MSIKDNALIVTLSVGKPQMTKTDERGTSAAERANNAHNAGNYRKNLYPQNLVKPLRAVESAARSYIESVTYPWARGEYLLPTVRFMEFAERIEKYEIEYSLCATAFLNNWANVMYQAKVQQGDMFDDNAYPDVSELKRRFKFIVNYKPVTDISDFRVSIQDSERDKLTQVVESNTKQAMEDMMRAPLERLREVVAKLNETMIKPEREVLNSRKQIIEVKPPIFRDSVVDNIMHEITLLQDFADILPAEITNVATMATAVVHDPNMLRNSSDLRVQTHIDTSALLGEIDALLED